jgi:DNA topoisomerase-1
MYLVVVESPHKAKTIGKFLGKDYKVLASKGHVADLPKSVLGVDVDHNFHPEYVVTNEDSLSKIREELKGAKGLILAVDQDREGEAIGWHIAVLLKLIKENGTIVSRTKKLQRIVFTEITDEAIKAALENPREIDMNMVNAQQARRVLDRIVGYKLSPLLWKKVQFGLSAGRVQSVAVRLIVNREKEREAFDAEEYWSVHAYLAQRKIDQKAEVVFIKEEDEEKVQPPQMLKFDLVKVKGVNPDLTKKAQVETLVSSVKDKDWLVTSIESREIKRYPKAPFTTSTLQQTAANVFGMAAKETMRIAQRLYESGMITYMRTDSTHLSDYALNNARKLIKSQYGPDYLPASPKFYSNKSKLAQEAHEAIRPSVLSRIPKEQKLDPRQFKIYDLIWRRTIASQMTEARLKSSAIKIEIGDKLFQLNGQKVLFPGFLAASKDEITEVELPDIKEGQQLYPKMIMGEQHFTKPPARYSEATLIKALESFGIGRPSTYAPIISTIQARKYVLKEGKYFLPTDVGRVVTSLLEDHFPEVVDTDFTAKMEADLDKIAEGKQNWVSEIKEFYGPFIKNLNKQEKTIKREDYTKLADSDVKCKICGKKMIVKLGRYGRFLSCRDFPKCKGMLSMDGKSEEDMMKEAYTKEFLAVYESSPKTDDNRDYLLKFGRFGKFWAHPDYPKVKDARPLEYNKEIFKKIYGNAPKTKDGKKMILRRGKFGEFWAHPNYPEKKEVQRLDKKKVKAAKEELGVV